MNRDSMATVAQDQLSRLLDFIGRLDEVSIRYSLRSFRDSVCVAIVVPGERWEVEFMAEGGVEVERFVSSGDIGDESELEVLFRDFA